MANLLDREWRTAEGFPARRASSATAWPSPPPGAERPANLAGGPRWTSVEEDDGRAKRFQGVLRRG